MAKELGPRKITANVRARGAIEADFGGGAAPDNPQIHSMIDCLTDRA